MKTMYYAGMTMLFVVVAIGFAACPSNSVVDKAGVTAALNTEKAKYQTGIALSGLSTGTDVSSKVVEIVAGNKADATITRVVSRASSGRIDITGKGSLVFRVPEAKEGDEVTDAVKAQKEADPEEIRARDAVPWREALKDIQVVTLQFEKNGVSSNLDVLVAFQDNPTTIGEGDTWLVYGYDEDNGKAKTKPVLDLAKLNAASWITTSGNTESLRYAYPVPLAMFAAQSFIDDVLSGTIGEIQAVYGTHLIVQAHKGGPKSGSLGPVADGDRISLWELEEAVKEMYTWADQDANQDANRQAAVSSKSWVSAVDIVTYDNPRDNVNIKADWYTGTNVFTAKQWFSGEWKKFYPGIESTDLNYFAGGKYIYSLFQVSDNPHDAIADLAIIRGKDTQVPDGWKKIDVDLNKGSGGSYLYLCYRKVGPDDTEAVSWIGAWRWLSKISDGSLPYKKVSIKWWGTNAERDSVKWVQGMGQNWVNPVDLNEGVKWSAYVYMTMEKKPFKW